MAVVLRLNVVLAAIALIGVIAVVPCPPIPMRPRLDWIGALLSLVAVSAAVFGVIEGPELGWTDPLTVLGLVVGVVGGCLHRLGAARRAADVRPATLPPARAVGRHADVAVQFFAAFGFFFIVLQYLQFITGRSPFEAAIALLPLPFILMPSRARRRTSPNASAIAAWRRSDCCRWHSASACSAS